MPRHEELTEPPPHTPDERAQEAREMGEAGRRLDLENKAESITERDITPDGWLRVEDYSADACMGGLSGEEAHIVGVERELETMRAAFVERRVADFHAEQRRLLHAEIDRDLATFDNAFEHTSMDRQELTRRVVQLAQASNRTANYVQGLPNRDDYEALMVENAGLREQFTALQTQVLTLMAWYENAGVKAA